MSARNRLILAIAAVVIVLIAFYFIFVRGRKNELSSIREQTATEQSTTVQLRAQLQQLQDLQANAPKLQAQLDKFRELVPNNHEIANFIFQTQAAADEAGVDFVSITPELPKPPPEGAALAEVRLQIGGTGGYFSLQDFIRRLYDLDRAVRIDNLQMSAAETETGGSSITLGMTVRIFFQVPGATGGSTTFTDTGTPAPAPVETTPAPATTP